jgi:hypothetical protein
MPPQRVGLAASGPSWSRGAAVCLLWHVYACKVQYSRTCAVIVAARASICSCGCSTCPGQWLRQSLRHSCGGIRWRIPQASNAAEQWPQAHLASHGLQYCGPSRSACCWHVRSTWGQGACPHQHCGQALNDWIRIAHLARYCTVPCHNAAADCTHRGRVRRGLSHIACLPVRMSCTSLREVSTVRYARTALRQSLSHVMRRRSNAPAM